MGTFTGYPGRNARQIENARRIEENIKREAAKKAADKAFRLAQEAAKEALLDSNIILASSQKYVNHTQEKSLNQLDR